MQIVQFVVDLHLVYFGSELNIQLMKLTLKHRRFGQHIRTLPALTGPSFRRLALAMGLRLLLCLAVRYCQAISCYSSSSTLIRIKSRLGARNQLRMDMRLQTGMGLSLVYLIPVHS